MSKFVTESGSKGDSFWRQVYRKASHLWQGLVSLCSSAGKRRKTRYLGDSEEYMAGGVTTSFKTWRPRLSFLLQPLRFRDIFLNR